MSDKGGEDKHACSFCGAPADNLVYGEHGAICKDCAALVNKLIEENFVQMTKTELTDIPKPREMKEFLDQYIIGQDRAKEKICVAVYNHYKRLQSKDANDDVEIEKSNVIIVGPTGTGKCVAGSTEVDIYDSLERKVIHTTIDGFIEQYL